MTKSSKSPIFWAFANNHDENFIYDKSMTKV